MRIDWQPVTRELAAWRAAGLDLPIWWRDDDAVAATPALDRLAALSDRVGVPVHLAVIPKLAEASLVDVCRDTGAFIPMVHGWAHRNHAPLLAKKAEFGHPRPDLHAEAEAGLARISALFRADVLKVFVPPWNRIDARFVRDLPEIGFVGLSTFTPRKAREAAPGLVQINTHIDPIHWRGGGGLVATERLVLQIAGLLIDRREGRADRAEPLGLLTHHLVHDAAIWGFAEECLQVLLDGGARVADLYGVQDALP